LYIVPRQTTQFSPTRELTYTTLATICAAGKQPYCSPPNNSNFPHKAKAITYKTWYRVVSPLKVSRFAPLNRYYIIIDEVFFDNFFVIIYLLGDKVYQLLAHGRWFSPGTPASSTTNTGRHDIAEILRKVTLKHHKSNYLFIITIPTIF
jgi:hypothetical protein